MKTFETKKQIDRMSIIKLALTVIAIFGSIILGACCS